ncbi:hypothetical protein [Amycolatopsis sp. GM8]|uniref:hypothetical protein n=1 Tax=Amycolatopsis sp. GM8 TaxID=2896530 RepID=UPI001F3E6CAD|nr:hypothetical protein [Amycolatopsis sp. GM8]
MTRIRLGWEARIDQIAVAIDFLVVGAGLVLLGALTDWSGWLTVPMIVIGVLILLIVALRMQGWRSLWWRRELVIGPEVIAHETKHDGAFRIQWSHLAAVGVHADPGADKRFGVTLTFFPKTADFGKNLRGPLLVRLPRNHAVKVRIPYRAEIADAFRSSAPSDWQRLAAAPWDVLVAAPGVAPDVIPAPDVRPPVVVDVGRRARWQILVGGVVSIALTTGALSITFGSSPEILLHVIGAFVSVLFLVPAVFAVAFGLVSIRTRSFVLDADSFALADSVEGAFTLGWPEITGVGAEISVTARGPGTWAAQRSLDQILVFTQEGAIGLRIGSQQRSVDEIARGVQQFAPELWAGQKTVKAGRFQIR